MGLLNSTSNNGPGDHFFAVELDTIKNNEFHDIDDNHVGVDINTLTSVGQDQSQTHKYSSG